MHKEYQKKGKSVRDIASALGCSENKVTYWLQKHQIPKRTISEAIYLKGNPKGNPFTFDTPQTREEWFLYGLGLGLYWGEGNKVNKQAVRLGNTDPGVIRTFLSFLHELFHIDQSRLRFGLQVFSDVDPNKAKRYWCRELQVSPSSFQKVVVTKSRKEGTYRSKNLHGVLTIYFSNTKLRDSIVSAIEELQTTSYAILAQSVERIHGKSQ